MHRITLIFAAACLIIGGPLSAHGAEQHGNEQSAQSDVAEPDGPPSDLLEHAASSRVDEVSNADPHPLEILRNLHPAAVHFPIALLLFAAAVEGLALFRASLSFDATVRLALYFAAAGTLGAAILGWVHTGLWLGGDALMQRHRWLGTVLVVFTMILAWLASRSGHSSRTPLRIGLALVATLVVVQGYLGAELAHGPNHLFSDHDQRSPVAEIPGTTDGHSQID